MEIVGKLIICDRCGETVFVKTIGDGEADGGYTRWNKFESPPDGWEYILGIGRMCPKCSTAFHTFLKDFLDPTAKVKKEG